MVDASEREGDSLWSRLRHRKVVQWGIAYAAGAWGFLQGLQYISEAFAWPTQIRQVAILALLMGLPITLVVAWYHGDRGEQRVGGTELAILTLLFLLGGGMFWTYERRSETPPTTSDARVSPQTSDAADERPSIAVLPFENRSRLADDAFFVDGIHDDVLTQLSKVGALKVIARTSVQQFRDTKLTTKEIGEKLGVTTVLEGGVQRAGDRVRINVQLIDANTDTQLWAERYDRELNAANIFAIQSEVATEIAGALNAALTPAERARASAVPTRNLRAWEAYQLGKQRMAKRASSALADAEQFFREAINQDPKFALAYVGLADTLSLQVEYSGVPRESGLSNAEKAVGQALKLDPNLAEAWVSSGLIAASWDQHDRAEAKFLRAIELNPNYAPARHWYSNTLGQLGRTDESLAQIQRAVDLDPLSAVVNENLGERLAAEGRFHEAGASYRRAITIDPSRPGPYLDLARLNAYAFNQFADAVTLAQRAMDIDSASPIPSRVLADLYFDLGQDDRFIETTEQAAKRWPNEPFVQAHLAFINLLRRDVAGAVRHAQSAVDADPQSEAGLQILRNADLQNGRYEVALVRYEKAYPELFDRSEPDVDWSNYWVAFDIALVFQKRGDNERANELLDGATRVIRTMPRLGVLGFWISDVQIHALRGDDAKALTALRDAERAGWRQWWRYHRDFDPILASIRSEPEFKAVFADIERDMARQRVELAARRKDAPLDLAPTP